MLQFVFVFYFIFNFFLASEVSGEIKSSRL